MRKSNSRTNQKNRMFVDDGMLSSSLKMVIRSLLTLSIFVFILPFPGSTHPGNTDSNGCHYCEANCSYWGENWNQPHCHNNSGNKRAFGTVTPRLFDTSSMPRPDTISPETAFNIGERLGQARAQQQQAETQAVTNFISGIVGAMKNKTQQKNAEQMAGEFRRASEQYQLQYSDWNYYAPVMQRLLEQRIHETSPEEALSHDPLEYYHAAKNG